MLLSALDEAEEEVRAACTRSLEMLKEKKAFENKASNVKLKALSSNAAAAVTTVPSPMARRPTVVIVGGGFAGSVNARWFDKWHPEFDLILVDPKEYHEFVSV